MKFCEIIFLWILWENGRITMESNSATVRRIIIVVLCSLTTSGAVVEGHQTFQNGYFHGHFNGIQPTCEPIKIGNYFNEFEY